MINEEELYKLEQSMKKFWADYGNAVPINAKHTTVNIEPRFIVGNRVNPEVAKRIISVYLSQITSDRIVNEQIMIGNDGIRIFDNGELVLEIVNQKLVDNLANKVTKQLGKELSKKQNKAGGTYIESKTDDSYTFGEIKQALVEFLMDAEKNDSKNLLKDAILLLVK